MDQQEHIGIRLKKWIEEKGFTALAFAEQVNIQRSALSHLFSGRNKPSVDVLYKMKSTFPDLDLEWLITGELPEETYVKSKELNIQNKDIDNNEFTDVNTRSETIDILNDTLGSSAKTIQKKDKPKLIRIIELYSDNSFRSYDA